MFAYLDLQMIFILICDFGAVHIQNLMMSLILRMLRQFHMLCVEALSGYCKQIVVLSLVKPRLSEEHFVMQFTSYEKVCSIMYLFIICP